jgi:serine/threonine-protein kinase
MSPEQATAERMPDSRSDVYSLGAVLYEMLAGEPPVTGPTAQAVIAKLLTERPVPLRVVRDGVPEVVEAVVARALAKTPADRFAEAGEFAAALHRGPAKTPIPRIARRWLFLAFASVLLLLAGTVALMRGRAPENAPFVLGRSQQLTAADGLEIQPSLSPDGNLVAYAAGNAARMRIYIRPVGGGRTIALSDDTSAVEHQPRWSPDGASLLFLSRGGVSVASALGGSSRTVVQPATLGIAAAAWSADGSEIVFVRHDSLLVVPVAGGAQRLVATEPDLHSCDWSPDGRWIACVQLNHEFVRPGTTFGNLAPSAILLFQATGGPAVRVVDAQAFNQSPVWSPDARWLYFLSNRDGLRDIYAIAIESSGRPGGVPVRVTTGLGASSIALDAENTRLSYTLYTARSNIWSLPIAAAARPDEATALTSGSQVIESLRISRDGRWLLFDSDLRGNSDAYRMPVGGGDVEQLTSGPADEFAPDLSPDGRWVAYHSWRSGNRDIEIKAIEGGMVEFVTATTAQESYPTWSPDGDAILFHDQTRPFTILVTRRDADGQWTSPEVIARPGGAAQWSPDGQAIAYIDAETHAVRGHVMIIPAGGGPPRRVLASSGAPLVESVLWSRDGRTLYLKTHDSDGHPEFWTVDVAGGVPRLLVRLGPHQESARRDFAVDETRLYFTLENRQSDVYVAELQPR